MIGGTKRGEQLLIS
uniref:Uncharacterized protein n=1 Tax=Arundo donax TaxID=35708 RepID=A0A0A8Y3F8_ARUDO